MIMSLKISILIIPNKPLFFLKVEKQIELGWKSVSHGNCLRLEWGFTLSPKSNVSLKDFLVKAQFDLLCRLKCLDLADSLTWHDHPSYVNYPIYLIKNWRIFFEERILESRAKPIPHSTLQSMAFFPGLICLLKTTKGGLHGYSSISYYMAKGVNEVAAQVWSVLGMIRQDPSILYNFRFGNYNNYLEEATQNQKIDSLLDDLRSENNSRGVLTIQNAIIENIFDGTLKCLHPSTGNPLFDVNIGASQIDTPLGKRTFLKELLQELMPVELLGVSKLPTVFVTENFPFGKSIVTRLGFLKDPLMEGCDPDPFLVLSGKSMADMTSNSAFASMVSKCNKVVISSLQIKQI